MRSDRLRLQDILDAIEVVVTYLPADRTAFDSDPPLQSHIYRHVDWDIVFRTARDHVPALKPHIEALLASLPPEEP